MTATVGVIGYGRIARPVIEALHEGEISGWRLASVLTRHRRRGEPVPTTDDPDRFFAREYDLIVEAAGPTALLAHGVRAIGTSDVWTVSGTALCDRAFLDALTEAGRRRHHRLRLVAGAIAGLDGVSSACVDPTSTVRIRISLPSRGESQPSARSGSVREVASQLPDLTNVAVAAAVAGPGLDATHVEVTPTTAAQPELDIRVESSLGHHHVVSRPLLPDGAHPVAACLIAALRRETQVIWAG